MISEAFFMFDQLNEIHLKITVLNILLNFGDGFIKGIEGVEMPFILTGTVLILIELILIVIGLKTNLKWFRTLLGIISVFFLVPAVFCFLPEMKMYMMGTILFLMSFIGIFVAIKPWQV